MSKPCSGTETSHVKGFGRIDEGDGMVGKFFRDAAERYKFMSVKNNIRMNLIHTNHYMIADTQFSHPYQFFPGKASAGRVLWIADKEDLNLWIC